jgi:hypothetical protein
VVKLVPEFLQALPAEMLAGLFVLLSAMRFPTPLESRMYGNPERVLEEKQAAQANAEKRAEKRRTLTVKAGWSEARKAAEALFTPPQPVREL